MLDGLPPYNGKSGTADFYRRRAKWCCATCRATPSTETVGLDCAAGRVLAEDIAADRDTPALARSVRDGFAVRAADVPGELTVIGEVRAGERFAGAVEPGQAVEIMTGAPVPDGRGRGRDGRAYDAVEAIASRSTARPSRGQFINPRGCEAAAGEIVLRAGTRLDYSGVALLASVGRTAVQVYRRPTRRDHRDRRRDRRAATRRPAEFQIRNSNAWSLAAQVARAGGIPASPAHCPRHSRSTRASIVEQGLAADLLLLSGGVSAGKYDVVEPVLADLGAEFFFDRVLIQPGQPLVFGRARGRFFFGLPGNPASTMVTFEIFARAALELLGGEEIPRCTCRWRG